MNYIYEPRGFRQWGEEKHRLLDIHSDYLDDAIDYIEQENIDLISMSHSYGFQLPNIEFILRIKGLKGIHINGLREEDISAIERCPFLEYLSLSNTYNGNQPLDLSRLPNLQVLCLDLSPKMVLPSAESSKKLEYILLSGYRNKTFESMPTYTNLSHMNICHGSLTSLSGLERFQNLKIYEHHYGKNLIDISAVTSLPKLESLQFDRCKKIKVDNIFEECHKLRSLAYFVCPDIPSLSFLNNMKELVEFRFGGCCILDGDLTPLLNLKTFAFYPDKKHYSHKEVELKSIHELSKK